MAQMEKFKAPTSVEDLRKLSVDDLKDPRVAAVVDSILKTGSAPRAKGDPETVEDLRRLSVDDFLDDPKLWDKAIAILTAAAAEKEGAK